MRLRTSLLLLCLAGCSSASFNTNLPVQMNRSLSATPVVLYSQEEVLRRSYEGLGEVVATACQTRLDGALPSNSNLTRELKLQTRQRGGNALVLYQCADRQFAGCYGYRECIGYAYKLSS
ncbi:MULTISPECIES: Rcs stress response system protein RcsF [Shewanella]|uniref:Rcs stress response system protein RcsF n=1 Tax=Shewanella TaxID=22 RepID=UPI001C65FC9F|nr:MULTISPECIES: Rcs stress response system protein RcsF [Shewanella]QYJ74916.1 hypothetical protein K0H79_16465 [Shewanella sp. FJAT-52076]QYK04785.1 hypothetical protein K0H63_17305 [Shewanella zhangzhouensis]